MTFRLIGRTIEGSVRAPWQVVLLGRLEGLLMADHNDPNAVNSIFSDIDPDPADLYDMFGFPGAGGDTLVVASTFAAVPSAGVFDTDMLYRMRISPRERAAGWQDEFTLDGLLRYVEGVKDRFESPFQSGDVRAWVDEDQRGHLTLTGFPGGDLDLDVPLNEVTTVSTGAGDLLIFMGGRDDAFFNDLPGFFRSINYAPQYYHVPHESAPDLREVPIPKTLLELEGNHYFNFDPTDPEWGIQRKRDLPAEPMRWSGDRFARDADGNYRLVYSGVDAQAGINVNCVVLEIPLGYLSSASEQERVVDVWAESWVRKAANKVELIPDDPLWAEQPFAFLHRGDVDDDPQLRDFKRVDTTAQPFADAALNERVDSRQVGGQLHARTAFREAAGPSGLGLRSLDHCPRPALRVRPRRLVGVGAQGARDSDHSVRASPTGDLPAAADAG